MGELRSRPELVEARPRPLVAGLWGDRILQFSQELYDTLLTTSSPPTMLSTSLHENIERLPELNITPNEASILDEQGVKLWNLCSKLKENGASIQLLCLVRAFSSMLLHCCEKAVGTIGRNMIRVFKILLRACKLCLDVDYTGIAGQMIEICAHYDETLKTRRIDLASPEDWGQEYSDCYAILRIDLGQFDFAETWANKVELRLCQSKSSLRKQFTGVVIGIGDHCTRSGQIHQAVQWLMRLERVLRNDDLGADPEELVAPKLALLQSLLRLPPNSLNGTDISKLNNLSSELEASQNEKAPFLLTKLESCTLGYESSMEAFEKTLLRLMQVTHLTTPTVDTIIYYVHRLKARGPWPAFRALEYFIAERLLDAANTDWIGKFLVMATWNHISPELVCDVSGLRGLFDLLNGTRDLEVSSAVAEACLMLIFRAVEHLDALDNFDCVGTWCTLGSHALLKSSGQENRTKLQRRYMLCVFAHSGQMDTEVATSIMDPQAILDAETQFILFKMALQKDDQALASESLHNILESNDSDLAIACLLEAQQTCNGTWVFSTMVTVLNEGNLDPFCTPALYRCAIQLLLRNDPSDSGDAKFEATSANLCQLFESACRKIESSKVNRPDLFPNSELEWLSKASYNLGLKFLKTWSPIEIFQLIQSSIKFLEYLSAPQSPDSNSQLQLRWMLAHYLSSALSLRAARFDESSTLKTQHYRNALSHSQSFSSCFAKCGSSFEQSIADDLRQKSSLALIFEFEACMYLQDWNTASQLVQKRGSTADVKSQAVIGDLIISSKAPIEALATLLEDVVNISWQSSKYNVCQLSRWIRCLFQTTMEQKIQTAETLLEQACAIAETENSVYPDDELEWLAIAAFNRAIDFHGASKDTQCSHWMQMALSLAKLSKRECIQGTLRGRLIEMDINVQSGEL